MWVWDMGSVGKVTAVAVVMALVVAACTGAQDATKSPEGTSSSALAETTGQTSDATRAFVDPCEVSSAVDLFAVDAAAEVPVFNDDGDLARLGEEGARAIAEELLAAPSGGLCTLETSPAIAASLDAVRAAVEAGDQDEAARILEELIAADLSAWMPAAPGILAAGSSDSQESHLQRSRDWVATAEAAEEAGMGDLASEALGNAADEYEAYALGDENHSGALDDTTDIKKILDIAATGERLGIEGLADAAFERARTILRKQFDELLKTSTDLKEILLLAAKLTLLGDDDAKDEAMRKAREVLKKEIEAILKEFDPCTATDEEIRKLADAAAKYELVGGEGRLGQAEMQRAIEIREQREAGEPVPACDALNFSDSQDIGGVWQGTFDISMATCDGVLWEGTFGMDGAFSVGDASGTISGNGDLAVEVDPATGFGEATFTYSQFTSMRSSEGSGTHDAEGTGSIQLQIDREARTAEVTIAIESWTATITGSAGGVSGSGRAQQEGFTVSFETKLVKSEPCKDDTAAG